ncbi:hybrid sensor histidine kinase/response regulator [Litoreibacter arenae]|uniref:histidine kinase n=1 Tax=Litoreibacter arenae DSM 19593 TaxID=1123360 RepID=S9RL98_9RHOB|nr:PAS domain-containing sensor histidine kinase [Litoreibacter arenae]EPX78915.1 sensory box histidine kinase/response regulator [Litoreibacter arenae DSM 19593]
MLRVLLPIGLAAAAIVAFAMNISNLTLLLGAVVGLLMAVLLLVKQRSNSAGPEAVLTAQDLVAHDERSIFITDSTGEILYRNAAAKKLLDAPDAGSLDKVLGQFMSNASAIVFRLQAKAQKIDAAHEDVVTRRGNFRIAAHRIANSDYLSWRIHSNTEFSGPGHAAERLSLPMFTVGGSGAVLFMNDAMRQLVGGRTKKLDAIFVDIPRISGQHVVVSGTDGGINAMVIIVAGALGRTEYFLAPVAEQIASETTMTQLEDFPIALLELDPDGRIKDFNRIASSLLSLEDQPAETMGDLIEGLGRPIKDWLSDAAEGKGLHKPEVLKCSRGPDEMYVQVTLGRVISDGEVSLIVMVNDATELKSLEAQFVQSQKMQAIGQLAGGVAHDFNNLLTAISGHCDLLMLRHDQGDGDYADLEQINQNANRAASLVGQLLAFSRKQNLQLEVLDMRDTLSDLTHLLNRLVGAQISLTLTHDPNLMSVRADRRQLEQVLMNLVVNARDALDGQGKIEIETRNIKLTSDLRRDRAVVPAGDYVVVKVTDDGCGIPADKMPKIFEPFYTTKKTGDGTGLGLSTAYGIVKQSGGFIFVDSDMSRGTVFTVYFPTHDRPLAPVEPVKVADAPIETGPADGVVLLVEDEAPVRAFASRALQYRGFEVIEADCGETALDLMNDSTLNIDVVLTDVIMPGMDGPTWVKEARKTRPNMRVVFMSGYADGSTVEEQLTIPESAFLPKPFSLDELTSAVRKHLRAAA